MPDAQRPRLSVIGTGYLGATHAVCMAQLGFEVIAVDIDPARIALLAAGRTPFYEPGLAELLTEALAGGRLTFTTDLAAAADADIHFLCVGTPQEDDSYAADLTYLETAVATLAPLLTRRALVVGKSTVPAGTARRMAELLRDKGADPAVELAWNPEFLREGHAVADTLHPDRLVFGVESDWAEQQLRTVFAAAIDGDTPVIVTDFATAELVKVAANSFLATKISFINAMAEVCETVGADVTQLADAIGHDARIGRRFLNAGLGFGGGCLPKDIRAFIARAGELGVDQAVSFLRDVDEINKRRRTRTAELAHMLLGGDVHGARITVLGAAFKPDSDDVRDSPALDVAQSLHDAGALVTVYDPRANRSAQARHPQLRYAPDLDTAMADADLLMLLTEWDEFRSLDPVRAATLVRRRNIVDGRTVLDPASWRAAGWSYRALGRR